MREYGESQQHGERGGLVGQEVGSGKGRQDLGSDGQLR